MYVNANMIFAENVPGIKEEGMKDSNGGDEFKYNVFDTL
jgi:hypothetical protein